MAKRQLGRRRSGPPSEGSQDFLTTAQVALRLGISPRTICYWAASGTLPGAKVGRQWRFQQAEVRKWVESRRLAAGPRQRQSFPLRLSFPRLVYIPNER